METRRRTYWRLEGQPLFLIGLWTLVISPIMLWSSWSGPRTVILLLTSSIAGLLYLGGPAVSVTVTASTVVVRNTFLVRRIARSLIVLPESAGSTELGVTGQGSVDVGAFETFVGSRPLPDGFRWLRRALNEVAPWPDDGRCSCRINWFNVVVTVTSAVGVIASYRLA